MRDWDKTIDELRKNIEDARKRWVLPYLDPTQFDAKTSENKSKVNAEAQNISTNEVSDTEKVATEDSQVVSSTEKKEAPVVYYNSLGTDVTYKARYDQLAQEGYQQSLSFSYFLQMLLNLKNIFSF